MRSSRNRFVTHLLCILTLALSATSSVLAQMPTAVVPNQGKADNAVPSVEVTAELSHPDQRDYVRALKGREVFQQLHALAPEAVLHFKLYTWNMKPQSTGVKLRLKSASVKEDIAIGADWTFDLPDNAKAEEEQGDLVTNRMDKSFAWRPDIRTPGLPKNVRRLGDLRLECRVDLAAHLMVIPPAPINLVVLPTMRDPCGSTKVHYLFIADRPIFGVTLASKNKRQPLQTTSWLTERAPIIWRPFIDLLGVDDRVYEVPLADTTWSDDTQVELEYMDDLDTPAASMLITDKVSN